MIYEHYGILQYRSGLGSKWRCCRDTNNNRVCIIGWNGPTTNHIPVLLRPYIRLVTNEEIAAERGREA